MLQKNDIFLNQRSDLATECMELSFGKTKPDFDGIKTHHEKKGTVSIDTLDIMTDSGADKIGKPKGRYITLDIGKIWLYERQELESVCDVCSEILSELIPKTGSCLLAGLGNAQITADSQGPLCADFFIVNRHIKQHNPQLFSKLNLFETMCITPDVLGNTGVEAALTVKGIVDNLKPSFVIAVDSLASRKTSRLATTLQISNVGITPGSGVGNHRMALNSETLGVPVISMGIPTVVDAVTVGADILEEIFSKTESASIPQDLRASILKSVLESGSYGYFVTPKNSDVISKSAARLIAMTINKALNPHLSYSEMEELI